MVVHLKLTVNHVKVEHCFVIIDFTYAQGSKCKIEKVALLCLHQTTITSGPV